MARFATSPRAGFKTFHKRVGVYPKLFNDWLRITSVLNELSVSMGQAPFYPFILPAPVVAKLQLVHEVIGQANRA